MRRRIERAGSPVETHYSVVLRGRREEKGFTQRELARRTEECGVLVTAAGISRLELGDRTPTLITACVLADALGTTVDSMVAACAAARAAA